MNSTKSVDGSVDSFYGELIDWRVASHQTDAAAAAAARLGPSRFPATRPHPTVIKATKWPTIWTTKSNGPQLMPDVKVTSYCGTVNL